jgi:hypothetical protein
MNSNHRQGRRSGMTAIAVTVIAVVVMFAGAAVPAQAQTPTVLHTFPLALTDACKPEGNIVQGRDGNMYGDGAVCGANGGGAVYKISPAGAESVFYSFPQQWTNCGGAGQRWKLLRNLHRRESGNWPRQHFPADASRSVYRSA